MKLLQPIRFWLILSFITISLAVFSQNLPVNAPGIIKGRVLDIKTNLPIPFVALSLTDSVSTPKSLQNDLEGKFVINNLKPGNYTLKISYVGYQNKAITQIAITDTRLEIDLGDILLNANDKLLNEVVVTYQKPVVEMHDDKLVYNISETIAGEGSVAADVLKNVPMVSVDIDGKATIAGRRNTRIFIDGKPSDYSANSIGELLSILPSDALESIEVITDPSSKFDADGDGIINIVMKKGRKVGLTGTLSSRVGTLGNHNTGAFLSSKGKKFSFNANAGYSHALRLSDANSNRTNNVFDNTGALDTTFFNDQTNNAERITDGVDSRVSITYQPDSAQVLKATIRGSYNDGFSESFSDNLSLTEERIERNLLRQNNTNGNNSYDFVMDADYTLRGKNKQNYTVGINYNRNNYADLRDFSRFSYRPDGTLRNPEPTLQQNSNNNIGSNLELNLDYDKTFKFLNTRLETGFKINLNNSDESQLAQYFDYDVNQYVVNDALTNAFLFKQNVYASYLTARFRIKKWSIRAGTRAELTNISFIQENMPNADFRPYMSFFPSLAVTRSFSKTMRGGLNYSRRITRPRAFALNPLIDNSDSLNIRFGNINLRPSFTDQYEANITFFGKGWSVSPRISYAISSRIIERIKTPIAGTNGTETTYLNLGNSSSINFNTFANYQIDKTKNMNAGFTISRVSYESAANSRLNNTGIAVRANAGMSYSFDKSTAMEANLNYIRNVSAQGIVNGYLESQFGFKRNFLKNRMSARVTMVDPFSERNFSSITQGQTFFQESFSLQRTRNFMAALSYRFTKINGGNTKAVIPKKRVN
ncbi:outer membrane beta-barrel protein [Pedobacter puniceum]|uniref:outer membrane beta-barrel protein n=1 Tax=Pedobacter puniceum TaxID=2666136 RepID=UPI0012B04C10|nr:outer membrane beta-barrel family protein [Pedobacter puniceum]